MAESEEIKGRDISSEYGEDDEEFSERDTLTFDEVVSFTMFAEFFLVCLSMGIFLAHFLLNRL
jgi:hypothetical protein